MQVVRAIALRESESEQIDRMALLERQLFDPLSASRAALQLEAIGQKGVEILRKALKAGDMETRFYAAEALAYLDEMEPPKPWQPQHAICPPSEP